MTKPLLAEAEEFLATKSDPDFDVVSLCNLLCLYGYELTGTTALLLVVKRIRDGSEFSSGASTANQWIAQIKQWEAQPYPNEKFISALWSNYIIDELSKCTVLPDLISQAGKAGLLNANGTKVSTRAAKPFITPGNNPIETSAQARGDYINVERDKT